MRASVRPAYLVAYDSDDPLGGGLMFCQHLDICGCVRTWDVPQAGRPRRNVMPPRRVVEELRQAAREYRCLLRYRACPAGGIPQCRAVSRSPGRGC